MEGYKHIEKIREYCDYLENHLENVEKAWEIVKEACKDFEFIQNEGFRDHIELMVKRHDLSKFSKEEFIPYCRKFFPAEIDDLHQKLKDLVDADIPKEDNEQAFEEAWEHHKKHNDHHWENWTELEGDEFAHHQSAPIHMIVDWTAMSLKFGDTPLEFYEHNKDKIDIPAKHMDFIYDMLHKIEAYFLNEREDK